ncbi:MAG: hypothetical protein M1381_09795 [Deltaproteobacteria bacterium]|nr:hypothetical protein [Deltaproteobacteria bacterium]
MKVINKIIDIILGLFLIMTGLFLLLLYVCLHAKADNALIAFSMILFLLVLGIGAIVLGVRRIFSTLTKT